MLDRFKYRLNWFKWSKAWYELSDEEMEVVPIVLNENHVSGLRMGIEANITSMQMLARLDHAYDFVYGVGELPQVDLLKTREVQRSLFAANDLVEALKDELELPQRIVNSVNKYERTVARLQAKTNTGDLGETDALDE